MTAAVPASTAAAGTAGNGGTGPVGGESRVPVVHVADMVKQFGEVTAVTGLNLDLYSNEFVSVVGASGCGKSTLLSVIAGLESATSGTVEINGEPVHGPGRDRGVVFQQATLLPWLTVSENVMFALRGEEGMSRSEKKATVERHLELVGLEGFGDKFPNQLSGGMQQRAALARSLSYRPKVLLMDEPFGALDALTRRSMQALLTRIWEEHKLTVMLITHDIEEAVFTADRVVIMSARPGTVKREVRVDLPRPRDPSVIMTPEFRDLYADIMGEFQ
ncbi:ABC transporter ATP-binding protein [Corynebacterium provencense]|uniref:Bicarbonate transport ATP-binding protein CmpD n=1 Tax=Corynebacterium provencense TaxID=1737425 RepID=A0A2Z3YMA7_9CORY|nr:ABC transporter ATP-binding protein [Corynebacterium provencense]AWT25086.1 Bicarbonate transport ATP-binding protein CmpD [Corynebacterium provencense]